MPVNRNHQLSSVDCALSFSPQSFTIIICTTSDYRTGNLTGPRPLLQSVAVNSVNWSFSSHLWRARLSVHITSWWISWNKSQMWGMSWCLCILVHVHLNVSFSKSALLIFDNRITIMLKWMTKAGKREYVRGRRWWQGDERWTEKCSVWLRKGEAEGDVSVWKWEWVGMMLIHYSPQRPRGQLRQDWFRAVRFGLHHP